MEKPRVLFLQGLASPFYNRVAKHLVANGCYVTCMSFCIGDRLFWWGPNPVNYRGRFEDWGDYVGHFLEQQGITDILLIGEQRTYHKVAIREALARGVRVNVTDGGYLRPDWVILERDGTNAGSHFPRDPARIREMAKGLPKADLTEKYPDGFWAMAIYDMIYHFMLWFWWFLYPHYKRSYRRDNPFIHYPAAGLRLLKRRRREKAANLVFDALKKRGNPFFLFPLQMEHDFSIVAYSPFDDLETPVEQVIRSFAKNAMPEAELLVKLHPLDTGVKNWEAIVMALAAKHGVAERVLFVDGGDLGTMIRGAEGVVTINSTVGIHAIQAGCPVITMGEAIYNVEGLASGGEMDAFWRSPQKPDAELVQDWVNLMAASVHVRGRYYTDPGLNAAATETAERILQDKVGKVFDRDSLKL